MQYNQRKFIYIANNNKELGLGHAISSSASLTVARAGLKSGAGGETVGSYVHLGKTRL